MTEPTHGVNVMLVGATGTGKTYSIRTLLDVGITPFCLFTEPGFESVLGDLPKDKIHWCYIPPANPSFEAMIDSARKINTLSLKSLSQLADINKREYAQFVEVIAALHNFKCARTGEEFGDIGDWGPDRAIVVDSLSGLNIMAMSLVVGSKPVKSMADWGIAMSNLEALIQKLCTDTRCHFILTAHLERSQDEITGGLTITASVLGKKLAPKIPRFFDDVINCQREGTVFTWSTAALNVDLKARNLPISDKLEPSFVPLINNWRAKAGGTEDENAA